MIVRHLEVLYGLRRQVQYDLAVVSDTGRNQHLVAAGIDQDIRRRIVVQDPFVKRPDQVRLAGRHFARGSQATMSRSCSDRLA